MMDPLCFLVGDKTTALLDIWTVEHVASGISVGALVQKFRGRLGATLACAFAWETVEHYLEAGLAGLAVADWFCGVEFWANRCVADPAALVAGAMVAERYRRLVPWARVFSVAWLLLHVVILPDSMFLHRWLAD